MVVGVSKYGEDIGQLKYTAKEARDFADLLTEKLEFDPANVRLLADGGTEKEAPSSTNILANLDALLADPKLDRGNLFVFYFSGHGVATPKGDFLLPSDTKKDQIEQMGVPVKEVISKIAKAGLKNVLFITDACRAGTKNDFGIELASLCHQANLAVILGCAPGKRSYEYPELKQGAFTHCLLEALQDSTLRDGSGALWASKLGQQVQKKVFDFTEPDHGKFAQLPMLWGDDSTLDVLLAAYPSTSVTEASINSFKDKASRLSRQEYVASLTTYAEALAEKDRNIEAIEILKVVEQLGELEPASRYLLAASLDQLGRSGEANKVYDPLFNMKSGFWKDLAQTSSLSRALPPKLRLQAAQNLLQPHTDWELSRLAWLVIDLQGSQAERLKASKIFADLPNVSQRRKFYAKAQLALTERRWKDALKLLDAAHTSEGNDPNDENLMLACLTPLFELGDQKSLNRFLDAATQQAEIGSLAYLLKAKIAKERGDSKVSLQYIQLALKGGIKESYLFLAVKIAGPYIGSLQDEFLAAAAKSPYSWKAHIVTMLMKQLKGDTTVMEEYLRGSRYVDDELTFYSSLYDMFSSVMAEELALGTLKQAAFEEQINVYFLQLIRYASNFGFETKLWKQFLEYGLFAERSSQVEAVIRRYIPKEPKDIPINLRFQILLLAMNEGDSLRVEALRSASLDADDVDESVGYLACFDAIHGKFESAQALIKKAVNPSSVWVARLSALKAFILASSQKSSSAKIVTNTTSKDLIVQAFYGLTLAAKGDWVHAEPLLARQGSDRIWTFQFLQQHAVQVLYKHYRSVGNLEKARSIAMDAMERQPSNPMFSLYSFATKPDVTQFAGQAKFRGLLVDDELYLKNMNEKNKGIAFSGSLTFKVDPSGIVSGDFKDDEGTPCTFVGTIDKLGNVKGKAKWLDKIYRLAAKLAPFALYKSAPEFKTLPQYFELINDDGYRLALLGYPSGKLPQ